MIKQQRRPLAQDEVEQDFPDLDVSLPMGERLVLQGLITKDQLRIALTEQKSRQTLLGATLLALGFISEEELAFALAESAGVAAVDLHQTSIDEALARRLPQELALDKQMLPLKQHGRQIIVAMADPFDIVAMDALRRNFPRGSEIAPRVAARKDILAKLHDLYGRGPSVDEILRELEETKPRATRGSSEHPVIRLVDALLADAVTRGASDIHLEPENSFVRVRLRIDGALRQTYAFHLSLWPALSHRIKIKAGMNIADTRSIQDGRFRLETAGHDIDCRVAIMPSIWGETIVIRLLDHARALRALDTLGYGAEALARIRTIAAKPHGIILLTGPTGSGKTTTLYSLLQSVATPDIHVATLEDPVEYQMDMVRQTAIQDDQGLGFAEGVRGLLRMDPDVILIGEIRDSETAQMALRAAMTGHQVYATLHCNDALSAIPRLIDLGLSRSLLAGHLCGIVAQRLVRCLCPHCKKPAAPDAQELHLMGLAATPAKMASPFGCECCDYTGRTGRSVVAEVLPIGARLDDLIACGAPRGELWQAAREEGLKTLREDGLEKVCAGAIALEDLKRQVDLTRGEPA